MVVLIVNLSSLPLDGVRIVQTVAAGLSVTMGVLAALAMALERRREQQNSASPRRPSSGS